MNLSGIRAMGRGRLIADAAQIDLFGLLGPWQVPMIDAKNLGLLEQEGRSPFGSEDPDQDALQGMAEETLLGMVWELHAIEALDFAREEGRAAFKSDKAWQKFLESAPIERANHQQAYDGTLSSVIDVWGLAGGDAFDREARRRAGFA